MGYKLLLADDSITIQKVVSIIFANEECELTIVDNGNAALEKAREMLPDIMLVDTLMPGMNGYEVCEHVRREPALSSAPLLLLTGAFEPFDAEKARVSGADDYISKPFESQILIEKVSELVQIGRERRSSAPAVEENFFPLEAPPSAPQVADEPAWSVDSSVPGWGEMEPPQDVTLQDEAPSVTPVEDLGWVLETTDIQQNAEAFFVDGTEPKAADADALPLAEGIVEASPEDDLWGAFSLESADEEGSDASEIIETYRVEDAPSVVDATEYSFSEEDFGGRAETQASGEGDIAAAWDLPEEPAQVAVSGLPAPQEADAFAFGDTVEPSPSDVLSAFSDDQGEEAAAGDETPVSEEAYFFTDAVEPAPFAGAVEPEPEQAPSTPAAGEPGSSAGAGETAGSLAASSGAPAGVTVTDEQLATMLSKISREVIERIVWEVVPDLAETLIKEEIRRIKEGR